MPNRDLDVLIAQQLVEQGKIEDSLKLTNFILNEAPEDARAVFVTAFALLKSEKHGLAYNLLKRCAEMMPHRAEVWNNLGMALIGMQKLDEAEECLKKALKRDPKSRAALNNLALLCVYQCNPEKAIAYAERSFALFTDEEKANRVDWDVRETYGYAHLMLGNFEKGWDAYESMIGKGKHRPYKPMHNEPYWDGSEGNTLYVRGEQGVGDEISFASILPDAMKRNKIVLDCDKKLEGLFKRSFPMLEIHGTRKSGERDWGEGRDFDFFSLLGTFAKHYRQKKEDFPGTPYLIADPERRLQWRILLDTLPGLKIGIAWTGGLKNTFKARRSFNLEGLAPILKMPGVTWVSLQYQDPTAEIEEFRQKHGVEIRHWRRAAESEDYDDQAALVSELDLVITVCTATVHLCGALGKEAWCLVPSKPRWFYQTSGNRLPWYNSVELFRQTDKWPVEKVAQRLAERVGIRKAA